MVNDLYYMYKSYNTYNVYILNLNHNKLGKPKRAPRGPGPSLGNSVVGYMFCAMGKVMSLGMRGSMCILEAFKSYGKHLRTFTS